MERNLYLLFCLPLVMAYPGGAPLEACSTMTPRHNYDPQSSPAPYTITLSKTTYAADETVQVQLQGNSSGDTFVGFLLEAQRIDDRLNRKQLIGKFTVPRNSTRLDCESELGNALTHNQTGNNPFVNFSPLAVNWTAPTTAQGHLRFIATFLINFKTYWVAHESPILYDPTAPPLPVDVPTTPSGTDSPIPQIEVDQCGRTKGCYREPGECTENICEYLVTWTDNDTNINFELSASDAEYIAIGFSNDKTMPDSSVTVCALNKNEDGRVTINNNYNLQYTSARLPMPQQGLSLMQGYWQNGRINCRFSREKVINKTSTKGQVMFNLTKPYYLLMAKGDVMSNGVIKRHSMDQGKLPRVTIRKVNLTSHDNLSGGDVPSLLVKFHACLMIISWMLLASCGMVIARFFKRQWDPTKLGGKDVWFQVHRACMILAVLLTCAGIVAIFLHVQGFTKWKGTIIDVHPVLGLVVTGLALLNPTIALFRPSPNSQQRPIFNWVHWSIGNTALVASMLQIILGTMMPMGTHPKLHTWVFIGWVIFFMLTELILEFHDRCIIKSKENTEKEELLSLQTSADGIFKTILLALYLSVTFATTGCVVYLTASA